MTKSINKLVREAHANAVAKGWWEEDRSFGELIALIHSEASEALEDFRKGHKPTEVWYEHKINGELVISRERFIQTGSGELVMGKPCGIPSELADIVIRVFDACGRYCIDLEKAIKEKMAYNATRPIRHGGKVL
jgi:NTP pyrophosphatase (non-canonical NTP hydrolase)